MRHVCAALTVLFIGGCGKGAERTPPTAERASGGAAAGSSAPTPAPGRPDLSAALALPRLDRGAPLDAVPPGPLVIIGETAIVVDGDPVASIQGGAVPVGELAADAAVLHIPKLIAWAEAWRQVPSARDAVVAIAATPSQPAAQVLQVIASFARSGQRDFALLARGEDAVVGALPVSLRASAGAPAPAEPPLGMVLSFAGASVELWSQSGQEGTLAAPRAVVPLDADGAWVGRVRAGLAEVVARRWAGRPRPVDQTSIVIMAHPATTAGALVAAIAAVRQDVDRTPLFPDVRLSPGFVPITPRAPGTQPAGAGLDRAEVRRQSEALIAALEGDGPAAGTAHELRQLGAQLDAARSSGPPGGTSGSGRGEPGTPLAGGDVALGVLGASPPAPGPVVRVTSAVVAQASDTSLSPAEVSRKVISAYLAGLKRCYREALALDPALRGAVRLDLAVNGAGRVTAATVRAMTPALASCIDGQATNWRFPVPRDGAGAPAAASFTLELALAPS